jgi:sigma-B regulation protein RsbU (phosphoserine phosphatase)
MTIRRRLLSLLLIVSLIPFSVTFALRQLSARMTRKQVGSKVSVSLDQNARMTLTQLFQQYDQVLVREQYLMNSLLKWQAREVSLCLETSDPQASLLRNMPAVYAEISQFSPYGFQGQCSVLVTGFSQIFPELTPVAETHDVREQPWFLAAQADTGVLRVGPYVDAVSGQTVFTMALGIRDEQGQLQAVTAFHRALSDLFANIILPEQWAAGAETMAVMLDPNASEGLPDLIVALHPSYAQASEQSGSIERIRITLEDLDGAQAMVQDLQMKRPGVHRMAYRGRDSLWAFGKPLQSGLVPLVVVSYDRVTELVATLETFILGESIFWWQVGGAVLLLIFVTVILVGVAKARAMTEPIGVLSAASTQLAAGDYSTRIHISTGDELQTLGDAFNEIGPHLEDRERMKRSLEIAGAIQKNLLPQEKPKLVNFEIGAQCVYSEQTGGDYYDFVSLEGQDSEKLGIALGDVTGHGIGAALLMAAARGIFRHSAREFGGNLPELFAHFNEQLALDSDDDKFITLFYGILDGRNRSMTWASGGHDPAIWYHRQTDKFEELPNTGPPVGLFEDMAFEQLGPVVFEPGDILVVGTDGIWETYSGDNEMFGWDRLLELIRANKDRTAQELCACVTEAVLTFAAPSLPDDDVTLVVIKTI